MSTQRSLWIAAGASLAAVVVAVAVGEAMRRERRRKRRRRLSVRVSSRYAEAAIREAASFRGLVIDGAAPCEWADFSSASWDDLLNGDDALRRASSFYTRASLVRKGMLAHYLQKQQKRAAKAGVSGGAADVLPPGIIADLEDEEDIAALQRRLAELERAQPPPSGYPAWVAKASAGNRGENLFVGRTADEVVEAIRPVVIEDQIVEWVVQRYVAPPLLLRGRKFHVRAHLLVSGCPRCGTIRAWLHRRHHALLLATTPFSPDNEDRLVHLTNHCVQVDAPSYDEEQQILLLEELDAAIGRKGVAAHVQAQMEAALASALTAAAAAPAGFWPLPQCFELFGADFTLEDRGSAEMPGVWLLEVNAGPDLAVFGHRLRGHCVELLGDVLQVAVEPYLCEPAPRTFSSAAGCPCTTVAGTAGFSDCLWSAAPKTASAAEELAKFKQRLGVAGRWARSLHESSGIAVRGPQSRT